jgi:hypothetical protein
LRSVNRNPAHFVVDAADPENQLNRIKRGLADT